MNPAQQREARLPLRRDLALMYAISLLIALLMAAASIAGLLRPDVVYPADELVRSFVPTDAATLFIGLPVLLGSIWLTWRGKLVGLLFWPGALLFVLYNYIVYVLGMPLNWLPASTEEMYKDSFPALCQSASPAASWLDWVSCFSCDPSSNWLLPSPAGRCWLKQNWRSSLLTF
jgi:hypothetical protein